MYHLEAARHAHLRESMRLAGVSMMAIPLPDGMDRVCIHVPGQEIRAEAEARRVELERALARLEACYDNPEFDATDGAHPAWWRGCDYGYEKAAASLREGIQNLPHRTPSIPMPAGQPFVLLSDVLALFPEPHIPASDVRHPNG
jgi:hypothetical protein